MAHEWTLSWFDARDEHFVGERTFETLSDEQVAEILGVPVEEVLGGEWPIEMERGKRLETATGYALSLSQYDYFLGATAVSEELGQTARLTWLRCSGSSRCSS